MRVLISGQAGVAVVVEEDHAASIEVGNPIRVPRAPHEWPYLLDDADDVYELSDMSDEEIVGELDLAWRKDRSLHLVLILLEGEADRETRSESAELLEQFVADKRVFRHILDRLHVAPLPRNADVNHAIEIAEGGHYRKIAAILTQISKTQHQITRCRQAWDLLPPDLFGSAAAKESFGFEAVGHGLFTAMASPQGVEPTEHPWADSEVIRRWKREIKSLESSLQARHDASLKPGASAPAGAIRIRPRVLPSGRARLAFAAAAAIIVLVAAAMLLRPEAVPASDLVQLGTSQPGVQVVQASFKSVQLELYGRTLVPYPFRSQQKREAERLFARAEADAKTGRLETAAMVFRDSNASSSTLAARLNEAVALFNASELTRSESLLLSLLPEAERSSDKLWKAAVLTNLGNIYRIRGRFNDADSAFSTALQIDRQTAYKPGEAVNLNNLALVLSDRGKEVEALKQFQSALSVSEQAGIDSSAANSRVNIGLILSIFGRSPEAEQNFKSAAMYYETQGSALDQAYHALAYGHYLFEFVIAARFYRKPAPAELDQAQVYFRRAVDLYASVSNKSGQASALQPLGATLSAKGDPMASLTLIAKALTLNEAIGALPGQARALRGLGAWYAGVKAYDKAIASFTAALNLSRKIGAVAEQCQSLEALTMVMVRLGHPDEALKYEKDAVELASKEGDASSQAVAYDDLGFLLYKLFDQKNQAIANLEHAYDLYSEIGSPFRDHPRELIGYIKTGTLPPSRLNEGLRGFDFAH